jgi:bla regulator protein blaR1
MLRAAARWLIPTLSVLWCTGTVVSAQTSVVPAFEVASVKPVKEFPLQRPFGCGFGPGGRFRAFGTLQWLIACAYGVPAARAGEEITGGPTWLNVDLFDIEAKSPPDNVPRSQVEGLAMLRTLLAERFKLAIHRETKAMPIYALMVARRDGKLGPRLRATPRDCAAWIAAGRRGTPPTIPGDLECGRQIVSAFAFRSAAMPLSQLANLLSPRVERPVQDRTGLTGTFALDLAWKPEPGSPNADRSDNPSPPSAGLPDHLPTSVFTALREQLGLKLQPTKGAIELLVIDHLEHPTPN